jgi:hypothetical protein
MIDTLPRFEVTAIPKDELNRIRAAGHDDFGNLFTSWIVEEGEEDAPLRCCLRDSRAGARVGLISYSPPLGRGNYAEVGPVFVHAETCEGYATPDRFPPSFVTRQQVLRTYDEAGKINDAVIVAGGSVDRLIAYLVSRPGVAAVESRNVLYGCDMFTARRAT